MFNHSILLGNVVFKYDVMGNLRQNSFSPYSRCISREPKDYGLYMRIGNVLNAISWG